MTDEVGQLARLTCSSTHTLRLSSPWKSVAILVSFRLLVSFFATLHSLLPARSAFKLKLVILLHFIRSVWECIKVNGSAEFPWNILTSST